MNKFLQQSIWLGCIAALASTSANGQTTWFYPVGISGSAYFGTSVGNLEIRSAGVPVFGGRLGGSTTISVANGTHFVPWQGSVGIVGNQVFRIRDLSNNADFGQTIDRLALGRDYGLISLAPMTNTNVPKSIASLQITRGATISGNWNYALRLSNQWQGAGLGTEVSIELDNGVAVTDASRNTFGFRTSAEIAGTGGQGGFYRIGTYNNFGDGLLKYNELFRIRDNGQVSIGSKRMLSGSSADFKLSVDGKIVAQKLSIIPATDNSWADYVFEPQYKLTSLKDAESFWSKNGHLHFSTSGKQIEEQGIETYQTLREHQIGIEELFLHSRELEKELAKEREMGKAQQMQIEALERMLKEELIKLRTELSK